MERYFRASRKQLDYIATLTDELDITNPTLYSKYNMEKASKLIEQLKRKIDKRDNDSRQTKLL